MTVTDIATRRPPVSDDAVCACGSMWFRPVRVRPDGGERPGAVTLTTDGSVYGYVGTMRCVECGNDFKP